MRVISGLAKGRPLKTVKSREIRPTADRVRESLFNVLGMRIEGACFLDLFAGSGAVGIEALSRGATKCVFVELQTEHLKIVEENLLATGLREGAELIRRDARAALPDLHRRQYRFDLIFIDPPYGQGLIDPVITAIAASTLLAAHGWVICEHHKKEILPMQAGSLRRFRELIFGETILSLYNENRALAGGTSLEEGNLSREF